MLDNRHLQHRKTRAYRLLKWVWPLITIILLVSFLWLSWQDHEKKEQKLLNISAEENRVKIDLLFNKYIKLINQLPDIDNKAACNKALKTRLRQMTFENPALSGFFIADKTGEVLCTTAKEHKHIAANDDAKYQLKGPFHKELINQPIYVLLEKNKDGIKGTYIIQDILADKLYFHESYINRLILEDRLQQKTLLTVYPEDESNDKQQNIQKLVQLHQSARQSLNSLPGIEVVIISDDPYFIKELWYNELFIALIVIMLAIVLYWQIERILVKRFSIQGALKYALKHREFLPHYQPLYNMKHAQFLGVEVLLRWQTDSEEMIRPDLFIEEAEQSGLIVPITYQIVEQTLIDCQAILHENAAFHVGFNLSSHHFDEPAFFDYLIERCQHYKINPNQILLELTERHLPDLDRNDIKEKVEELKALGFSMAIDDYGTGHASISYLQQFPFDYLKIDKMYIQSIGYGAITEKLTETIIEMAQKLELKIIAEGVETKEQLNYLKAKNIDIIQGWYFAKAMHINDLNDFLKK